VLNAHGSDLNVYVDRGAIYRRIAADTLGAAAFTIAASGPIRDRIVEEFGVPGDRVEVIPSGIDSRMLRGPGRTEARASLGIPDDVRVLLYVGDLTRAKGIRHLASVIDRIHRKRPDVWTCIVGRGPAGGRLEGRDRVILSGPIPNDAVPEYLAAADIFVFPSLSEGTPVSLMEAQAAGLPVVASRIGGVPDIVKDGISGLLAPPGDEEALEGAILRLLDDPDERSRLARGARADGEHHASGDRSLRVAAILEHVVRSPSAGAFYDRYWRGTRADRRDARSRERAIAALRFLEGTGRDLLDVGCGRGVVAAFMQKRGFRVRAIDVSEEAVKEARSRGVEAEVIDIEKDTVPGSHDVILCLEVLEHLKAPGAALDRLVAALRPGGRMVISLPEAPPVLRHGLRDGTGHLHRMDRSVAMRIFQDAGLRLVGEDVLSVAPPRWRMTKALLDGAARRLPRALGISRIYALEGPP
jgi:2-polyprenyl-3-methyl-5-hydroxy-6-metoxy-1,4-benzoquinol methylase